MEVRTSRFTTSTNDSGLESLPTTSTTGVENLFGLSAGMSTGASFPPGGAAPICSAAAATGAAANTVPIELPSQISSKQEDKASKMLKENFGNL